MSSNYRVKSGKVNFTEVHSNYTIYHGLPGAHTYQYDALGRRVAKTVHDQTTNTDTTTIFVNARKGSMGQILAEYLGNSTTLLRKYLYGEYIDEPICMLDYTTAGTSPAGTTETTYYHRNRNYNILGLTDSTSNKQELYHYTSHGNRTIFAPDGITTRTTSVINNNYNYTFTGRELDPETNLIYFRARILFYCGKLDLSPKMLTHQNGRRASDSNCEQAVIQKPDSSEI